VPLMVEKIAKTKDEKALLKLLLSSNKKEYKPLYQAVRRVYL